MKALLVILVLSLTSSIGNCRTAICQSSRVDSDLAAMKVCLMVFEATNGRLPATEEGFNALA